MKKFETRLRIIMTLEKLEGRRNLRARHGSRLTVSSLHVYTEIRGQRGVLEHLEIPGVSLNLQDPLLRLTGIRPRQTGGTSIPLGSY